MWERLRGVVRPCESNADDRASVSESAMVMDVEMTGGVLKGR